MKNYKVKYKNKEDTEVRSKIVEDCEDKKDAEKKFFQSFSFTIEQIWSGSFLPIITEIIEVKSFDVRLDYQGTAQKYVSVYAETEDEAVEIAESDCWCWDYGFDDENWDLVMGQIDDEDNIINAFDGLAD
jgi:hypothetical protein